MRPSTSRAPARILVVDDHPLYRAGLVQLLRRHRDLTCCGEAGTVAETLSAAHDGKPDLILLDLRLGKAGGLDLIKSLKKQNPAVRILVISYYDEAAYAERALRAGAGGYLMKEEVTEEVLLAIRAVLRGELYVSRKMSAVVLQKVVRLRPASPSGGIECLTDREFQIFDLIGSDIGTRRIAELLHLSVKTVEAHRENLKRKLGCEHGAALVQKAKAWAQGNPPPPDEP